jgi:5-methylcytosine-specific restriction endonuclease McrBC regulatory subunit McrC
MITVPLQENGAARLVELTPAARRSLSSASASWKKSLGLRELPLRVHPEGDLTAISAKHVAGTIRVGDVQIDIAPKFLDVDVAQNQDWQQAFWQILIIAHKGRSLFGRAAGTDSASPSIADLLAEIFLNSFARGSSRGLPLEYTEEAGFHPSVRGSFDSRNFSQWVASPWKVPSVETLLTSDTQLARLLAWAALQLRSLVSSARRARDLDSTRHQLPSWVGPAPRLSHVERLTLGVQHEALRPALDVAILLLQGHGVHHGGGDRDIVGFLWKSEDVYERFLFWLCREAGRSRGLQVSKGAARFGISKTASPLQTTPDVLFTQLGGSPVAVLDAKYKTLNAKPKAGDSYQILTSANHFGCPQVGLVYPASASQAETNWTVKSALGGEDVTITAMRLDLLAAASTVGRRQLIDTVGTWLDGLRPRHATSDLEVAAP